MKKKLTIILLLGFAVLPCIYPMTPCLTEKFSGTPITPDALITSQRYIVNEAESTISEVPYGETLEVFYQNISSSPEATVTVFQADMVTPATALNSGCKLAVSTSEGGMVKAYTIITDVKPGILFFSEYIEGNSNNKALEIFNPNDIPVKLMYYRVAQSVNGGGWKDYHTFPEGKSIEPRAVWVIINNKTNPELFNPEDADEIENTAGIVGYNGDDARGLLIITGNDTVLTDVIGIPDEDPGSGWNVAGITNATMNKTLIRKAHVTSGNTNWIVSAGTNADDSEWIVMPVDYFEDLGKHGYTGQEEGSVGISDNPEKPIKFRIYPNPAHNFIVAENLYHECYMTIMDITGRFVIKNWLSDFHNTIDITALKEGVYILGIDHPEGKSSFRFIKQR